MKEIACNPLYVANLPCSTVHYPISTARVMELQNFIAPLGHPLYGPPQVLANSPSVSLSHTPYGSSAVAESRWTSVNPP